MIESGKKALTKSYMAHIALEMNEILASEGEDHEFSESFEKRIERILNGEDNPEGGSPRMKPRRIFLIAAAIFYLATACAAPKKYGFGDPFIQISAVNTAFSPVLENNEEIKPRKTGAENTSAARNDFGMDEQESGAETALCSEPARFIVSDNAVGEAKILDADRILTVQPNEGEIYTIATEKEHGVWWVDDDGWFYNSRFDHPLFNVHDFELSTIECTQYSEPVDPW